MAIGECYHELEEPGTALRYDEDGTDRGNAHKVAKACGAFDDDHRAIVRYLTTRGDCNGRLGTVGMCLGGHLALRAAMEPEVLVGFCLFATDVHKGSLGKDGDDSMARIGDGHLTPPTEMTFVFGKQDNVRWHSSCASGGARLPWPSLARPSDTPSLMPRPLWCPASPPPAYQPPSAPLQHVPAEGRAAIYAQLVKGGVDFQWLELNAQHAFVRDELSKGRYDPSLTGICYSAMFEAFRRRLTFGASSSAAVKPQKAAAGPADC